MLLTAFKITGVLLLLSIPAALVLWLLGKPVIYLLFQHGPFKAHSSQLAYLALTGYAIGLPGIISGQLFASGFFALKGMLTPLCTNLFSLALRYLGILLLLHFLTGIHLVLAIPLALAISATLEAALLCLLLLLKLRTRIALDKGMLRLVQRRVHRQRVLSQKETQGEVE